MLFEVEDANKSYMINNKKSYMVNLEDLTCDYKLWQISSLPCSHAHLRTTYKAYVAFCFAKKAF